MLGERLNGIQEVSGSIPLISTTICPKTRLKSGFLAFPGRFLGVFRSFFPTWI
jgi:hypothetical protein